MQLAAVRRNLRGGPVVEQAWEWRFPAAPETLWPVLADTARFNEAVGLPRYRVAETPLPDGSVRRVGSARRFGLTVTWDEGVPQWVAPHRFFHARVPHHGPLRRIAAELLIEPDGAAGSHVIYRLALEPHLPGFGLLLRLGFLRRFGHNLDRLFREAAAVAAAGQEAAFRPPPPRLPAAARERLAAREAALAADGYRAAGRLVAHLREASDNDVERMRPRTLARRWRADPREVIETCLAAARGGLLTLRWDLVCPRCRGAKIVVRSLDELPQGAHCPSCNIAYDRDFSRNVEVTFDPADDIRPLAGETYCLASPIAAEHIKIQQHIAAGAGAAIAAELPDGDYRVRTVEPGGTVDFTVTDGVLPEIVLAEGPPTLGPAAPRGCLHARNAAGRDLTLVVEDRRWASDALTAHEVTTMQAFRDLFADAVLRPGDQVAIRRVTLMFTDISGSTELYNRLGDAQAYGWVRAHFAVLAGAVRRHNGTLVKTIGDAVMAAFSNPVDALAAAVAVRDDIAGFNRTLVAPPEFGEAAIVVKLGLHCGPCIAVTLNDRLDYFGSTVNLAARLEGQSRGGDIVLSEAVAAEPGVAEALAPLKPVGETVAVKGFSAPVAMLRVPAPS